MKVNSLQSYLRRQSIRWSFIGLALTLLIAVPCLLYSQKMAAEDHVQILAKSVARAFRQQLLTGYVRDAQFQIRTALELKPGESALVLDPKFEPIYSLPVATPNCTSSICWSDRFRNLTVLSPIYFDSDQKSRFGYLKLTVHPEINVQLALILVFLLAGVFIALAFGLGSILSRSVSDLASVFTTWAVQIKKMGQATTPTSAPFGELLPVQQAISELSEEIGILKLETAKQAKADGQLALLREISHDLKTPHSLLAKYFALHLDTVESTGKVDANEVSQIQTTLRRMGDLLRLVRVGPGGTSSILKRSSETVDLVAETKSILEDLRRHHEVVEKFTKLEFVGGDVLQSWVKMSRISYYRLIENLVLNATDAVTFGQSVKVILEVRNGRTAITVKDNGKGIDPSIRDKVFDFNFTTKPSRGTGLGLGIVNKICQEFGADLSFTSELGRGSEFTVVFSPANIGHDLREVVNAQL